MTDSPEPKWNKVEQRIIDGWIAGGMTREEAEAALLQDLQEAAEEDGYDGP